MWYLQQDVNSFKSRLDNFWHNQDIVYDYRAEIHVTGNRSEVCSAYDKFS